jgi:osmotically-inducible protein OsmY
MRVIAGVFAGLLVGIGLAFFFDPQGGTRRRHTLRDRSLATVRKAFRRTARTGRGAMADAEGLAHKAIHLREERKPQLTDETITAKVMSEVFRDPKLPKGDVNVNVEDGVAVLRGTVGEPELIDELVTRVRHVQGVRDVASLLHVQGTPAPSR